MGYILLTPHLRHRFQLGVEIDSLGKKDSTMSIE